MVYNKIDKNDRIFEVPQGVVCISAKQNIGIEELKQEIIKKLFN